MSDTLSPSERHIERLAVIRHQISYAEEQARQPRPVSSLALNTMQDFVESTLHAVAESHKVSYNNKTFDSLLENVVKALADSKLPGYKVSIVAMNRARVHFKHHGNSSDTREISAHLTASIEFVRELVTHAYGVDLDSVSAMAFIRNEAVKRHLEKADQQWQAGDEEAMFSMRVAFDELVYDYTHRKLRHSGETIFSTKPSFMPSQSELRYLGVDKMYDWIESIDSWMKYVALGIDMRRFAFFEAHTPSVSYNMHKQPRGQFREGVVVDEGIYKKCKRFVVDTALALMQDDYDFDPWGNRRLN